MEYYRSEYKMGVFEKVFGTHSEHEVKRILPIADKIEALEPDFVKLSDEELKAKTIEFKNRLKNGETLDDILPEAYATVREAAKRVIGQRHFHVQLIGGIILHQGRPRKCRLCKHQQYKNHGGIKGLEILTTYLQYCCDVIPYVSIFSVHQFGAKHRCNKKPGIIFKPFVHRTAKIRMNQKL
jgi:hypothetical protein